MMRSLLSFSSGIDQTLTLTSCSLILAMVLFAVLASDTVGFGNDDAITDAADAASGLPCLAAQFKPATEPLSCVCYSSLSNLAVTF